MPVEIQLPEDCLQHLSTPAVQALHTAVQQHVRDLINEASRLEAAGRAADADPEITATNVTDAALLLRRGYRQQKKKVWTVVMHVASPVIGLTAGFLFDMQLLQSPLVVVILALLTATLAVTTLLPLVKE